MKVSSEKDIGLPRKGIRIVPYNPDDYSLGEALSQADHAKVTNAKEISSILSLYFQWESFRRCFFYIKDKSTWASIELSYDQDEREPTELRVKGNSEIPQTFQRLTIRMEVFQTCYEFEVDVLAISDGQEDWNFLTTVPSEIRVLRARRLPRVRISDKERSQLPPFSWCNETSTVALTILEFGLRSALVTSESPLDGSSGYIQIGESKFSARILKRTTESIVILFEFKTSREIGELFDIYRRIAYPSLTSKKDYNFREGADLYLKTGYFEKFSGSTKLEEYLCELEKTWSELSTGLHEKTADYYSANSDGTLTGASSVVVAFYNGTIPVWVLHQLCAITRPDLLEQTRQLYTWRTEYLAAREENLEICAWFDSRSRWIDRIYVKFANRPNLKTRLYPVALKRVAFSRPQKLIDTATYKIGNCSRTFIKSNQIMAAIGPRLLNASSALDAILAIHEDATEAQINNIGNSLIATSSSNQQTIEVTLPVNSPLQIDGAVVDSVDRFCAFTKDDLIPFLSSIEHTFAVTRRKLFNE
jgi:hypothetical protein